MNPILGESLNSVISTSLWTIIFFWDVYIQYSKIFNNSILHSLKWLAMYQMRYKILDK